MYAIYNGHSSIGYGPLDPSRCTAADFPASYQILWVDGCVSCNYYEKDSIPLKDGATKNLDSSLRIVDGEIDNELTPARYPITVTSR